MKCFLFYLFLLGFQTIFGQTINQNKLLYLSQSTFKLEQINDDLNPLLDDLKCHCYNDTYPSNHIVGLEWIVSNDGDLNFEILPNNADDDIDFIMYQYDSETSMLKELRCSASGKSIGVNTNLTCDDKIGIYKGATLTNAKPGCSEESGFLANVNTKTKERFLLLVNNVSSTNGFTIKFSGTAQIEQSLNSIDVKSQDIVVYPIPVKDYLNIAFNNIQNIDAIEIFDTKLTRVMALQYNDSNYNVSTIAPGLYYLMIKSAGKIVAKKAFIKL